jgi:mercuric ion transport protein
VKPRPEKRATSGNASALAPIAQLPPRQGHAVFLAAGGVLGALAASACCIAPLVLLGLGITGAWIANLTALAPYQPLFVVITLAFLLAGFVLVYRKPKAACSTAGSCQRPISTRTTKIALWGATILIAAAIAFPYLAPLLLGS